MADNSHVTVTGVDFTWIKNWMTANSYLVYSGSLTTPPCTPVVRFLVSTKTAYISSAALAKLVGQWAGNQSFAGGRGNARNFFLPAAGRQVVLHRRP
jgi:carbonic anhydrase